MEFLNLVASHLCQLYGNNLSKVALVFPNKRAGLFFNDILLTTAQQSGIAQTVWSPAYLTISDLFDQLSPLRQVDELKAVCRIFQIYVKCMGNETVDVKGRKNTMTLDWFYGWGKQLLSDFSDIDCSLCKVSDLFDSVSAAKVLESLDNEQMSKLSPLVRLLNGEDGFGRIKKDFTALWNSLNVLYSELNDSLAADGEAYQGARQRRVIEGLENGEITLPLQYEVYAFVGFNLLLPTERALFSFVKNEGKGLFFWDYDEMYLTTKSPMWFDATMKQNLDNFSNALADASLFQSFSHHATINYVATQSSSAGMRYATSWLRQLRLHKVRERDMAIVLCDETQTESMIHCIPSEIQRVNVTKGFPMTHTPAYRFLCHELESWSASDQPVMTLVENLTSSLHQEAVSKMENSASSSAPWLSILHEESFFEAYTLVNRIALLVGDGTLQVSAHTLSRLIIEVLRTQTIPFHGEPLGGVQIMGMLETRNLDFPHLLMLSVGEGIVPARVADRSFIPFDLRKYYGIMTGDERSKVYAYNFYRLVARSGSVTMLYNASTDGDKSTGEMSRFMTRMLLLTDIPIRHYTLSECSRNVSKTMPIPTSIGDRELRLSPSSISNYVSCPLRFWFHSIAHINEVEPEQVILPANKFGSVFHKAAEIIMKRFINIPLSGKTLENLADNEPALKGIVNQAMEEELGSENKEHHKFEAQIIETYLKNLLRADARLCKETSDNLRILDTENKYEMPVTPDGSITLFGIIDRVDKVDGKVRIVDYKTGRFEDKKMKATGFEELFTNPDVKYVLQTFCYSLLYDDKYHTTPLPALYFVSKLRSEQWNPYVHCDKLSEPDWLSQFHDALRDHLEQLRRGEFPPTSKAITCKFCPYRKLCE